MYRIFIEQAKMLAESIDSVGSLHSNCIRLQQTFFLASPLLLGPMPPSRLTQLKRAASTTFKKYMAAKKKRRATEAKLAAEKAAEANAKAEWVAARDQYEGEGGDELGNSGEHATESEVSH
jgi:hypothetical protein